MERGLTVNQVPLDNWVRFPGAGFCPVIQTAKMSDSQSEDAGSIPAQGIIWLYSTMVSAPGCLPDHLGSIPSRVAYQEK